jgi:hypothetical protein
MSASSGWDHLPPPDPAPEPPDDTGEPVGYNLADAAMYEQSPLPPEPYPSPVPRPMEPALVATGAVAGVLGLLATPIMPPYTMLLGGVAALICGVALNQARLAQVRLPRLAILGLVLGVVGLTLGFVIVVMAGAETPS